MDCASLEFVMRLRAQIVIDIDALSFSEAISHAKRVEALCERARAIYGQTQLRFYRRRRRTPREDDHPGAPRHYTGRMSEYSE
jgi:hypothetical protein